ncbi:MAG TPA: hypothetical protein VND62_11310 [Acidimicrobiales bacterium]|nr:hypothetical protein [Acidimicrobiales bacterium]
MNLPTTRLQFTAPQEDPLAVCRTNVADAVEQLLAAHRAPYFVSRSDDPKARAVQRRAATELLAASVGRVARALASPTVARAFTGEELRSAQGLLWEVRELVELMCGPDPARPAMAPPRPAPQTRPDGPEPSRVVDVDADRRRLRLFGSTRNNHL